MSRIKLIVSLIWLSVCECKAAKYGHVQSPLYPEPYPVGLYMDWYLKVPHGYRIQLTFNHLDMEPSVNCSKDSLTVLHDREVLGKFCGQKSPYTHHPGNRPILSPGNHVRLVFETDESEPQLHHGFFAFYEAIVDCGIPELSDPDLVTLTEEGPLTTYNQNISFKCLSEFYQLVGHANFTCDGTGNWVSESGQNYSQNAPQCVPVCGINDVFSAGRVFGGERARLGQIPWQLLIKQPIRGGASLISDRWALTAAINVDGHETTALTFYGGMIDGLDKNAVRMQTEKIIIHPGYNKVSTDTEQLNYDNDIALVKMSARVPLSHNIRPVCLPEKNVRPAMEGTMGTVSGFGAVSEDRLKSQYLQYAHLEEYSEVPCFSTDLKVTDNMFCAGGDGVDACKGDSGGPLVLPMVGIGSPVKPYRLKGIVSWGPAKCGDKEFKGYYTKVQNYLDWIRETVEKN